MGVRTQYPLYWVGLGRLPLTTPLPHFLSDSSPLGPVISGLYFEMCCAGASYPGFASKYAFLLGEYSTVVSDRSLWGTEMEKLWEQVTHP